MRRSFFLLAVLVHALVASLVSGCVPAAPAAAQTTGPCTIDSECVLVDRCGCSCHAELGPALPPAGCSRACGGTPCAGHRAACRSGVCVLE